MTTGSDGIELSLVGTRALFEELSRRYDGTVLLAVRNYPHGNASHMVILNSSLANTPELLRHAAGVIERKGDRELAEGDL